MLPVGLTKVFNTAPKVHKNVFSPGVAAPSADERFGFRFGRERQTTQAAQSSLETSPCYILHRFQAVILRTGALLSCRRMRRRRRAASWRASKVRSTRRRFWRTRTCRASPAARPPVRSRHALSLARALRFIQLGDDLFQRLAGFDLSVLKNSRYFFLINR